MERGGGWKEEGGGGVGRQGKGEKEGGRERMKASKLILCLKRNILVLP